ncbi:MAG: hypothetical protein M1820_007023 [Bogoriella megaspora]|nr:MAG: hypothetical protein M1820_007023 [Bogoriella megaspora]
MEPSQDDGLKWFGEGFEGFPKRLPQDCVEYAVYIIHDKLNQAQQRARLQEINVAAKELRKKHLRDYIWQKEAFDLVLHHDEGKWALLGTTNFGDSVADEWVIVWMLQQLSKQFEDAWIRVFDTDGEFLLIEGANALPRWLNPEIAENRVWMNKGQLILIPVEDPQNPHSLSLTESFSLILSPSFRLIRSRSLEAEAFQRLQKYPEEIQSSLHNTLITIPRKVAWLLHHHPSYISPAVEAFYLRDPIALKPLQSANPKNLKFPPRDLVTVSVRFTKILYAQLKSQQFTAPPIWASAIPQILGMAQKDQSEWSQVNAKALARAEIGMKVTCGFEMLLQDPQSRSAKPVQEMEILLEDLDCGDEALPGDAVIAGWESKEDDEGWLDIDFTEFQKELDRKKGEKDSPTGTNGWGDKGAQENVKRMVDKFQAFMNDDGNDDDDDDLDFDESDSEGEDKIGSFDEDEFNRLMKEMMGMPAEERPKVVARNMEKRLAELNDDELIDESDEDEETRQVMDRMERELKNAGALDLNGSASERQEKLNRQGKNGRSSRIKDLEDAEEEDSVAEDSSDDDLADNDIDLNLAKNMMEAFKSQGGLSGPAGNMLSQMGIQLPRDDDDTKR